MPPQDGPISGIGNISQNLSASHGYRRGSKGLPPKYRQSFQQSHHASAEVPQQDSHYSNHFGRQDGSLQRPMTQSVHNTNINPSQLILAKGATPSTPTLPRMQQQLSTHQQSYQSAHQLGSMQSDQHSKSKQQQDFQSIAQQCQLLSERVQQRLSQSRRPSLKDGQIDSVSQGSRIEASEYCLRAEDEENRPPMNNMINYHMGGPMPLANEGMTLLENESQGHGAVAADRSAPAHEYGGSADAQSMSKSSPQRSPQKSQPRQRHL